MGIIFSIIAGAAMSIQGVFNTRLSEKVGLYEANTFVQGTAFVLAIIVAVFFGSGDIRRISEVSPIYWLGGVLGIVITVTVMLGISNLSPTVAISVILIAQLLVAALIDAFGLFGAEHIAFVWQQYAGILLMVGGVLLFKLH